MVVESTATSTPATGRPSGVLMRDGIVDSPPFGDRSSLGIAAAGALDVRRVEFFGTWRGLSPATQPHRRQPGSRRERRLALHAELRRRHVGPGGHDGGCAQPVAARDAEHGSRGARARGAERRRHADSRGRRRARGTRTAGQRFAEEAPVGTSIALRPIFRPEGRGSRRRSAVAWCWSARAARLRRERGVHLQPARAAASADRRRAARRAVVLVVADGRRSGYSVG